jgi:hypothetical protein
MPGIEAAIESAEESSDNRQVDCAEFQHNREIAKLIWPPPGWPFRPWRLKQPDAMGIQHK